MWLRVRTGQRVSQNDIGGVEENNPGICLEPLSEGGGRASHNESERGCTRILQRDTGADQVAADEELEIYLRWHLVHSAALLLSQPFVRENFNFYSKTLAGVQELPPRWKRCVRYTDRDLGQALGQPYVEETFGADGKERTLKMVHAIEKALREDIDS